jgi:hypothetical protein
MELLKFNKTYDNAFQICTVFVKVICNVNASGNMIIARKLYLSFDLNIVCRQDVRYKFISKSCMYETCVCVCVS